MTSCAPPCPNRRRAERSDSVRPPDIETKPNAYAVQCLEQVSRTDALTGLPNRRHLDEHLKVLVSLARRHGQLVGHGPGDLRRRLPVHAHRAGRAQVDAAVGADAAGAGRPARHGRLDLEHVGAVDRVQVGHLLVPHGRARIGQQGLVDVLVVGGTAGEEAKEKGNEPGRNPGGDDSPD